MNKVGSAKHLLDSQDIARHSTNSFKPEPIASDSPKIGTSKITESTPELDVKRSH